MNSKISYLEKIKFSVPGLVYLVTMKEKKTENDAWYYVLLNSKSQIPLFLKNVKSGIKLTDYGTVLYKGWGTTPPLETQLKVQEQFK
jgi:hypothetical protein